MKTLETRIRETLHEEAMDLPDPTVAKRARADSRVVRQQKRALLAGVGAFALVFLLLGPLGLLEPGASAPADVPVPQTPESAAPSFEVTEIGDTVTAPAVDWAEDASAPGFVYDILDSTGQQYDDFDDFIPDAAVKDGRVVIVGGNAGRTASIWYSDGGAWTPVEIDFPDDVEVGEGVGQYRLADGIQNVDVIGDRFVAWEIAQPVLDIELGDGEYGAPETLVFTSDDGISWNASVLDGAVFAVIPWDSGALAINSPDFDVSVALWTEDFATWERVAGLGVGTYQAHRLNPESIDITLRDYVVHEDDGVYTDKYTTRTVRLVPAD